MKELIEENWKPYRLKYLFDKRIGGAWGNEPEAENAYVCIRAADILTEKITHKANDLTRRSFEEIELKNKALQLGDLIIEKSGGGENQPVGRVAIFNLDELSLCSNFMEVLRPNKELVTTQFAAYLLYYCWFKRFVTKSIKQTTGIQNLDISDYLDKKAIIPSLKEQNTIVELLNKEIEYLDSLIEKKQTLINLLTEKRQALISQVVTKGINPKVKLKDSGIDWLGEVPEHWEVKKLKYLSDKIGSGVTPKGGAAIYQKQGIPLLRSQNVHFSGLRLDDVAYISDEIHESMNNSKVEVGDVLLNITGASIGRCYFYEGQLGEANVNQHVCIIRPNRKVLTRYLNILLSSQIGQNQILLNQVGGGREGLTFDSLKSFVFPLPDTEEQTQILIEIDRINLQLASLEKLTIDTIELLRERRQGLISAAVTGQLEIPL